MCGGPSIDIPEPESKLHHMDLRHLNRSLLMRANRSSGAPGLNRVAPMKTRKPTPKASKPAVAAKQA
jgi:hypothetical protein